MDEWVKRNSKILIILMALLFFLTSQFVMAGITGKIAGTIKDATTGDPLPGVNVVITGTTMGAATDMDGNYFIINLPPGVYTIEASMLGYERTAQTDVRVQTDHTTPVDFNLKEAVISGAEVTVVAEREVVKMDVSSSQIVAQVDQVESVPLVRDIEQYINMQAGIENDLVRGGGLDQQQFMVNGLVMNDNRTNRPLMSVNLSTMAEISIIKGGFNAEYGNVRSGLINVVTKDPDPNRIHGSVDFRISPARLKHSGASIFDPDNFYLRPYLDPGVMWVGTANGTWDEEKQKSNLEFMGWNAYSEKLLSDDDPTNDRTPEECRDLFMWTHTVYGSSALGQTERDYGTRPDWNTDIALSGGVPVIGKALGNLGFLASYRTNWEEFALPTSRDYFTESNASLKLTSRISPSMKLSIEGIYGETKTIAGSREGGTDNYYVTSGTDILSRSSWFDQAGHFNEWWPTAIVPFSIYRSMIGVSFDHVLSPSTFYNVRISHVSVKNHAGAWQEKDYRDTTTVRYFGSTPMDETPYGFWIGTGQPIAQQDGSFSNADGGGHRDFGRVQSLNVKFDITSQIDHYNQMKAGIDFTYDDMHTDFSRIRYESSWEDYRITWTHYPYRLGAYIQDKLEFQGMIANIGVRLDYNEPNTDWYLDDPYSQYFTNKYRDLLTTEALTEPAKGHVKISPRLGVSHPISENVKLYFSYGHFYSMPSSSGMYELYWGRKSDPIRRIGNPSADLPRTVAYELGVEYNIANFFLLHLAGFYKDVTDQLNDIDYTNYSGSVNYTTQGNNNYEDIRGFEVRLERTFGRWITGWLNYHYQVRTEGFLGRNHYFEDPRLQAVEGLEDPNLDRTQIRPYLRANVQLRTPMDWGPSLGSFKPLGDFMVSPVLFWHAGRYQTWNPLNITGLQNNVQWTPSWSIDMRISKIFNIGNYRFQLFADINNLLNNKYLQTKGFYDGQDERDYFESLHLPMYADPEYDGLRDEANGLYIAGDDKPGDVKSEDKPYINMPNRDFLTYRDLRSVQFGIRIDF
jgi:hypothetical protein